MTATHLTQPVNGQIRELAAAKDSSHCSLCGRELASKWVEATGELWAEVGSSRVLGPQHLIFPSFIHWDLLNLEMPGIKPSVLLHAKHVLSHYQHNQKWFTCALGVLNADAQSKTNQGSGQKWHIHMRFSSYHLGSAFSLLPVTNKRREGCWTFHVCLADFL